MATSIKRKVAALTSGGANLLYRWKRDTLRQAGPAARTLGDRVIQLEEKRSLWGGLGARPSTVERWLAASQPSRGDNDLTERAT